jgi:endogenous inhibitor of DNA gyrase (YacG/DUF329 family)
MIRGKCPTCGRAIEGASLDALPHFPFCSERCRMVDLGRWIEGDYAIPGESAPDPSSTPPGDEEDD